MIDQALSSATNFAVSILIAREAGSAALGAFALSFSAYLICLELTHGLATSPLTIRFSARSRSDQHEQLPACLGIGIMTSGGTALILTGVAIGIGSPIDSFFFAIAICLPGLITQSTWRLAAFAEQRSQTAALSDGIWAALQLLVYAVLLSDSSLRGHSLLLVFGWGLPATVSALAFCIRSGVWPSPRAGVKYIRQHRDILGGLLGDHLSLSGGNSVLPYVLALVMPLGQLGAFRAAQSLVSGINLPLQGTVPIVMTRSVRLHSQGRRLLTYLLLVTVIGSALTVTLAALLLAVPESLGLVLLGHTWTQCHPFIFPLALAVLVQWTMATPLMGLRARSDVRHSARVRAFVMIAMLGGAGGAGLMWGGLGAAWALVVVYSLAAILAWRSLLSQTRQTEKDRQDRRASFVKAAGSDERGLAANSKQLRLILTTGWLRSGTTILAEMLGTCPGVVAIGELHNCWRAWARNDQCSCGVPTRECHVWAGAIRSVMPGIDVDAAMQLYTLGQSLTANRNTLSLLRVMDLGAIHDPLADYLFLVQRLLESLTDRASATTLIDTSKSGSNVLMMSMLDVTRLDVIHLVRDLRGVAWSQNSARVWDVDSSLVPPVQTFRRSAPEWIVGNLLIALAARRADQYLRLSYEDVFSDPQFYFETLCVQLGLDTRSVEWCDNGRTIMLGGQHIISGNPNRFGTRRRALDVDIRWHSEMPLWPRTWLGGVAASPRQLLRPTFRPGTAREGSIASFDGLESTPG